VEQVAQEIELLTQLSFVGAELFGFTKDVRRGDRGVVDASQLTPSESETLLLRLRLCRRGYCMGSHWLFFVSLRLNDFDQHLFG